MKTLNKNKHFNGRIADVDRELIRAKRKTVQKALNLYVELERYGYLQVAVDLFKEEYPELYLKLTTTKKERGEA